MRTSAATTWKATLVSLVLAGLAAPLAGCTANSSAPTPAATQVAAVQKGDVSSYITANGPLAFSRTADLDFAISGHVVEVDVKEGDTVAKGQVLASLDTTTLKRSLDTYELAVKTAQAGLQDARDVELSIKAAEIDLNTALNSLAQLTYPYNYSTFTFDVPTAIVAITDAQRQLQQARAGLEAGPGSPDYGAAWEQFRLAQDNLLTAQQRLLKGQGAQVYLDNKNVSSSSLWTLSAAQLAVEKAQSTLDKTRATYKSGLDKAEVALSKAIKDRDNAREDLAKTAIIAPFNAIVTAVYVSTGDDWRIGQAAFTLAEPDKFEVEALLSPAELPFVREGLKTTLQVADLGARVSGTVAQIAPTTTMQQGVAKYKVKIAVDVSSVEAPRATPARSTGNPGSAAPPAARPAAVTLRQGLSVSASIPKEERKGVLLVPNQALIRQGNTTSVRVATGDGIEVRAVRTGLADSRNTEVLEGLAEGDKVVLPAAAGGR